MSPNGLREKDVVLDVTLQLRELLEARGIGCGLSREGDKFVTLGQRAESANESAAQLFVSVHANSAEREASGIETFHFPHSKLGGQAAELVQDELLDEFPKRIDRGVKQARFSVLRRTTMTAVLVELEFIHTPEGEAWFKEKRVRRRYAVALAEAVAGHLESRGLYKPRSSQRALPAYQQEAERLIRELQSSEDLFARVRSYGDAQLRAIASRVRELHDESSDVLLSAVAVEIMEREVAVFELDRDRRERLSKNPPAMSWPCVPLLASGLPDLTGNLWLDSAVVLVAALSAALLVKKAKDEFLPTPASKGGISIKPNPLQVKKASEMATKEDLTELKQEVDKLWDEMRDNRRISREALGKIHSRIDRLSEKTDTMSGEMRGSLATIQATLDKLLERGLK